MTAARRERPRRKAGKKKKKGTGDPKKLDLTVRLDRLRVAADYYPKVGLELTKGLRCLYDYDVTKRKKKQGEQITYRRVSRWVNDSTGTQIECAYSPLLGWLPQCVMTLIGNDTTGLRRREVDEILGAVEGLRLLHVEVAFDFDADSIVDGAFVRRHLLAGKARHYQSSRAPGFEYFGTRRSPKFARCYQKTLS